MTDKPEAAEEWRRIPTAPDWSVSSLGRVRRETPAPRTWSGRILKQKREKQGYLVVHVRANGVPGTRRVHQLVAEAFLGPRPEGYETCHYNGDRSDNRVENLRYDSPKGNSDDRIRHGTANRGERHGSARLNRREVHAIRRLLAAGNSSYEVAPFFKVSARTVRDIGNRSTWGWLPDESEGGVA